jgi:hypothetical protein
MRARMTYFGPGLPELSKVFNLCFSVSLCVAVACGGGQGVVPAPGSVTPGGGGNALPGHASGSTTGRNVNGIAFLDSGLACPSMPTSGPQMLVSGVTSVVPVDLDSVLVGDGQQIDRVTLAGGTPTGLAVTTSPLFYATRSEIFYENDATDSADPQGKPSTTPAFFRREIAAKTSSVMVDMPYMPAPWASDGSSVFFASAFGTVGVMDATSSSQSTLKLMGTPITLSLAADDTYLYAGVETLSGGTAHGAIQRIRKDGTIVAEEIVTGLGQPIAVAVDGSGIYWLEGPPPGTFGGGHLVRSQLDGHGTQQLAQGDFTSLALDVQNVYLLSDVVSKVPKDGGPTVVLANGVANGATLSVVGSMLIWMDSGTRVMEMCL